MILFGRRRVDRLMIHSIKLIKLPNDPQQESTQGQILTVRYNPTRRMSNVGLSTVEGKKVEESARYTLKFTSFISKLADLCSIQDNLA